MEATVEATVEAIVEATWWNLDGGIKKWERHCCLGNPFPTVQAFTVHRWSSAVYEQ